MDFTDINEDDLDALLMDICAEFPRCGEMMLHQILRTRNVVVTRSRLRESIHRHNARGISERRRGRLRRRVYAVEAPNCLWHIDTNHKLIRWHFIIAGSVDGFSRLITFLRCTNNNKAGTLLQLFQDGVNEFGTPLKIRCDKGLENIRIAEYMLKTRGPGSVIAGKSVHNQRIERLWRDVFEGVLSYFYELFHFLEDHGVLDILNETHISALHYVYLPRINEKLDIWRAAWAGHRLRTVRSSPMNLWTAGQLTNPIPDPVTSSTPITGNGESEVTHDGASTRPVLDEPLLQLSPQCKQMLEQQCPVDWISSNAGIDVYLRAVEIIRNDA